MVVALWVGTKVRLERVTENPYEEDPDRRFNCNTLLYIVSNKQA